MTADAYRRIARVYDTVIEPVLKSARYLALELWPPLPGQSVLDIGCGTGAQLDLYRRAGCRITGVDPSPAMVALARQKLGAQARVDLGDASRLPYPRRCFDLILMSMVLHEMSAEMRSAVIAEAKRVVRANGGIIVLEYHPGPLHFPRGWLAKPLILLAERLAGAQHFHHYGEFLAAGGMPRLALRNDLAVKACRIIKGGNFGIFRLELIAGDASGLLRPGNSCPEPDAPPSGAGSIDIN
jgi:ubiquinone/menaquinone biosynthesis C-methylase UbiE